MDKHGKAVDFLLRPDRGIAAAQAFFRKALATNLPIDDLPRCVAGDFRVPALGRGCVEGCPSGTGRFNPIVGSGRFSQTPAGRLEPSFECDQFQPTGGRVRVELCHSGNCAELQVIDSGEGIDPKLLPHVFERFWQTDSTRTRMRGGLGLGLAMVKYLVHSHGGTVEAASAGQGRGATFTVRLPLVHAEARLSQWDDAPAGEERVRLFGRADRHKGFAH